MNDIPPNPSFSIAFDPLTISVFQAFRRKISVELVIDRLFIHIYIPLWLRHFWWISDEILFLNDKFWSFIFIQSWKFPRSLTSLIKIRNICQIFFLPIKKLSAINRRICDVYLWLNKAKISIQNCCTNVRTWWRGIDLWHRNADQFFCFYTYYFIIWWCNTFYISSRNMCYAN